MIVFSLKRWAPLLAAVALCVAGCGDKGTGTNQPETKPDKPDKPDIPTPIFGTFIDSRDSTVYKTVTLNKMTWMAENLNYTPDSGTSRCYSNNVENCAKYGRLYDWRTAMVLDRTYISKWGGSDVEYQGICPTGWHLPSKSEWNSLINMAGDTSTASKKLKSKEGWSENGNGTDDYGFTALPGGMGCVETCFSRLGEFAFWWTATEDTEDSLRVWTVQLNYVNDWVNVYNTTKLQKYSVRCVQNNR